MPHALTLLPLALALVLACSFPPTCSCTLTTLELSQLRNSTVQLFKHAFGSYMSHAFPMDELRPLSCKGTDSFGGVSVTLIDSLDTLAVMGLKQEFAQAVEVGASDGDPPLPPSPPQCPFGAGCSQHRHHAQRKHQVRTAAHLPPSASLVLLSYVPATCFSVFEANIRLLGGLLSAHVLASDESRGLMPEYVTECCVLLHCVCAVHNPRAAATTASSCAKQRSWARRSPRPSCRPQAYPTAAST